MRKRKKVRNEIINNVVDHLVDIHGGVSNPSEFFPPLILEFEFLLQSWLPCGKLLLWWETTFPTCFRTMGKRVNLKSYALYAFTMFFFKFRRKARVWTWRKSRNQATAWTHGWSSKKPVFFYTAMLRLGKVSHILVLLPDRISPKRHWYILFIMCCYLWRMLL